MSSPVSSASDEASANRRHVRSAFAEKAEIIVMDDERHLHGRMLDLSKVGCLVSLTEPSSLARSARVEIVFRLNGHELRVGGEVKTRRSDTQIGIQFHQVEPRVGRQLGTLSSVKSRGKEKRSAKSLEANDTSSE